MAVSIADIDIDDVTLPETYLTDEITELDDDCTETQSAKRPNKISEKWDWNADFIPLRWDGTITVSTLPLSNTPPKQNTNSMQRSPELSPQPIQIQTKSPLKNTTQSYRDESKSIPPWISNTYPNHNFIDRLHMELVDFCMYVSPTKQEHNLRLSLIEKIKQIVLNVWPAATIYVFGSMKTKLYLPTSDIDLAVYPNTNDIQSNGDCKLKLAQALKQTNMCSYLEIISTARVPLIKFTHSTSNISVDIIFERESGIVAADEINSLQSKYPALRPLTYFLKYFLWFRNLNEPFRGGMGSYLLQMLIVHLIQTHPIRATRKWKKVDSEISLGGWLMAFFELYGKEFNYSKLGVSAYPKAHYFIKEEHGMKVYDRPHLLCCKCPFESTASKIMDSGRNTYNIMKIKVAFEWAHNSLLANAALNKNKNKNKNRKSILGLLVGIRGQMLHIRSNDNKLFQNNQMSGEKNQNSEYNELLAKTFESMSDTESEHDLHEDNESLFIPLQTNERSVSVSSDTTDSSSSYATYNTYNSGDISNEMDSDELLPYYEASEFQQKHLFNTNMKTESNTDLGSKNITLSFDDKNLDIKHNPYLNNKYDPFRNKKNKKKRSFSSFNLNENSNNKFNKTQQLKKRKTTSTINNKNDKSVTDDNNTLDRSYSMPNLRRKSTPCIFYQKGGCKKGKSCLFQHGSGNEDNGSGNDKHESKLLNQICWNFTSGHCHRGAKCRWLHSVKS